MLYLLRIIIFDFFFIFRNFRETFIEFFLLLCIHEIFKWYRILVRIMTNAVRKTKTEKLTDAVRKTKTGKLTDADRKTKTGKLTNTMPKSKT